MYNYKPRSFGESGYKPVGRATYPYVNFRRSPTKYQSSSPDNLNQPHLKCWHCDEYGHKVATCPVKNKEQQACVPSRTSPNVAKEHAKCSECSAEYEVSKPCGHSFDHGASVITETDSVESLYTCPGKANGKPVKVLLDSGCTTVGINKSLVKLNQYTGSVKYCKLFSGYVHPLPVANVNLDTPYFKGSIEACVIDKPPCDVILGRVPGAKFSLERSRPFLSGSVRGQRQPSKRVTSERKAVRTLCHRDSGVCTHGFIRQDWSARSGHHVKEKTGNNFPPGLRENGVI